MAFATDMAPNPHPKPILARDESVLATLSASEPAAAVVAVAVALSVTFTGSGTIAAIPPNRHESIMRGRSSVVMFICSCCRWLLFCAPCCASADGCADIAPSCHERGEKKRRGASVSFRPGKLLLSA